MTVDASIYLQEELDDEDDWNPSKAAGVCIMLLANLCEDDVLPQVGVEPAVLNT